MDALTFESELKRDGFTDIETKTALPNVVSPLHSHPCDIRALLLTGELTLHRAGTSRTYRAGDTVVLAAGSEHNGPEGYTYIVGRRLPG